MSATVIPFAQIKRTRSQRGSSFVLEMHSERFIDLLRALNTHGFRVMHVRGTQYRFRIEDDRP